MGFAHPRQRAVLVRRAPPEMILPERDRNSSLHSAPRQQIYALYVRRHELVGRAGDADWRGALLWTGHRGMGARRTSRERTAKEFQRATMISRVGRGVLTAPLREGNSY